MGNCYNIVSNAGGVPYLSTTNVTVSDTTVDLALGWYRKMLPPVGYFTLRIANEVPAGTAGTLPVTLTMNGITRSLTLFDGSPVTAAELLGGTGVITVFNDRFNGILQLVSRAVE